jgi:surface-anchored protein
MRTPHFPTAAALACAAGLLLGVAPASAATDPVVLSAGNLSLTPKLSGLSADGKDFADFTLGLLDKTGATPTWYAPSDVVIHLGAANAGADGWSTTATPIDWDDDTWIACFDLPDEDAANACYDAFVADQIAGHGAEVLLGADTAIRGAGPNAAFARAVAGTSYLLTDTTTPTGGRVQVRDDNAALKWDSGGSSTAIQPPIDGTNTFLGATFDHAGTYCLTVADTLSSYTDAKRITRSATYTVVVGDLPATLQTCAQPDTGGGGSDPVDDVTVLSEGHLDTRAWLNAAGDGLDIGVLPSNPNRFIDTHDLVLTGLQAGTVPADQAFLGTPGSTYWSWPQTQVEGFLWPGFSTENWRAADLGGQGTVNLTLAGVDGPGDVIVFSGGSTVTPGDVTYASAWGLPMTRSWFVPIHAHRTWAFTAAGRYCLNFSATTQKADGAWLSGSGMLTVWVGDPAAAADVTPCDRDTAVTPPVDVAAPATVPPASAPTVFRASGRLELQPQLRAGALEVPAAVRTGMTSVTYRDPDDLVLSYTRNVSQDTWEPATDQVVNLDTDRLPWGTLDGPVTVRLGAVRGPGVVTSARGLDSSVAGSSYTQASSMDNGLALTVSRAGVYCVPLNFSARPAGGAVQQVTKTLTIAAGSTDPSAASYVDRATLTSCTRGQQPVGLDDGQGGSDESRWNVPNGSRTTSGAVILNNGHVDLATRLQDGRLTTTVKDTTESATPTYRPLDQTVLQLLPGAETELPDLPEYAFLGAPGDPVWIVSQTQQDGLLWPGWSTEELPTTATTGGVEWTLSAVTGPGTFALFTSGSFGMPTVLFDTRDGITAADRFTIPKDTHAHGSWAFSAEGTYCLAFTRTATATDGTPLRAESVLAVSVGRSDVTHVDPAACGTYAQMTAPPVAPDPVAETPDAPAATDDPATETPAAVEPTPEPEGEVQAAPAETAAPSQTAATSPRITTPTGPRRLGTQRTTTLATIACPATGAACPITAPRRTTVTIAGRRFTATLLAPKTIRPGQTATLRVRLTPAAAQRLKGHTAQVRFRIAVGTTTRTVSVRIR